jgi:glucosamine--fructose-6-phosphate aminotransferase (isomerizing)
MCGIVGILGKTEVAPQIFGGLKRLEYRGYDSAGIAVLDGGKLVRRRAVGKLSELGQLLATLPLHGRTGIGHTRWATHGAVNETNAHPHRSGPVAVVHNGIIENYRELRADLVASGRLPETETDTEIVALLCARFMAQGLSPRDAAAATIARLEGAYALAFIFEGEEDLMIAARRGPPLALGHGEGEMFIGSDALALAPMTSRITYLEDGDWAVLTRAGATIHDAEGRLANREIRTVNVDQVVVDKGSYRHFMAKEIHEQPTVAAYALGQYLEPGRRAVRDIPGLDFAGLDRLVLVACGTASYACAVAKYWFETHARLPVEVDVASEFRYREPPVGARTGAIFVSQSGETADTLAALRYVRDKAAFSAAVVNVRESSIARESSVVLPIHAGTEIGVASTKAFTCQLVVLACLALLAGRQRGQLGRDEEARLASALGTLPRALNEAIAAEPEVAVIAGELARARDILFLGRGPMFPMAMEGALKLKEISYIHAEGYAAGELKHGPIALIDDAVPVIVLAPSDALFDKTVSNMQEVMARRGRIVLVSDGEGLKKAGDGIAQSVKMPAVDPFVAPVLYAVPAQLLAYHTALEKGTDVDQPRNLAKSVTVE